MVKKGLALAFFTVAAAGAAWFGLPPKGVIPVLNYHFVVPPKQVGPTGLDVSTEDFKNQMWFLKTFGFRPVTLDEYADLREGLKKPHGREILVTFDDGNQSYLDYALPILQAYQIPSANFLIWNNMMNRQHGSMDAAGVEKLAAANNSLVSLGSHSLTHAVLTEVSAEEAKREIADSRKNFEQFLNHPVLYFSYPTGAFDDRAVSLVKEAGYRLAFTTGWKRILKGSRPTLFSIPRIKVTPDDNGLTFWLKVSGIHSFFQSLRHRLRS